MREVVAVGNAHGAKLPADYAERRLALADEVAPDMTSSMHHDLQRGRPLEIRWLSGGVVHLGPGTYLTGTVILKSNVTLYLEAGATLLGSTDMGDYIGQPGNEGAKHYSLVFARGADRVAIAGQGAINGQGQAFWTRTDRVQPDPGGVFDA